MLTVVNRKAFGNAFVNLPNGEYKSLANCVWHGPKGFSSKPALFPVYGNELKRLFQEILKVSNVTSADAREYLEQLRDDEGTTMAGVAEVYVFLQRHRANE